ncbi:MAG: ferrous iron transport protein A [Acutalibacteraceae bacterium]
MAHSFFSSCGPNVCLQIRKHLENPGFVVGGSVRIISALGGNIIVNVKESRVAISEEMARKIMV